MTKAPKLRSSSSNLDRNNATPAGTTPANRTSPSTNRDGDNNRSDSPHNSPTRGTNNVSSSPIGNGTTPGDIKSDSYSSSSVVESSSIVSESKSGSTSHVMLLSSALSAEAREVASRGSIIYQDSCNSDINRGSYPSLQTYNHPEANLQKSLPELSGGKSNIQSSTSAAIVAPFTEVAVSPSLSVSAAVVPSSALSSRSENTTSCSSNTYGSITSPVVPGLSSLSPSNAQVAIPESRNSAHMKEKYQRVLKGNLTTDNVTIESSICFIKLGYDGSATLAASMIVIPSETDSDIRIYLPEDIENIIDSSESYILETVIGSIEHAYILTTSRLDDDRGKIFIRPRKLHQDSVISMNWSDTYKKEENGAGGKKRIQLKFRGIIKILPPSQ